MCGTESRGALEGSCRAGYIALSEAAFQNEWLQESGGYGVRFFNPASEKPASTAPLAEFHARKTIHSPRLVFADRNQPESGRLRVRNTSMLVLRSHVSVPFKPLRRKAKWIEACAG
jgi:hypothetical protein